jgi:hypothetical protein
VPPLNATPGSVRATAGKRLIGLCVQSGLQRAFSSGVRHSVPAGASLLRTPKSHLLPTALGRESVWPLTFPSAGTLPVRTSVPSPGRSWVRLLLLAVAVVAGFELLHVTGNSSMSIGLVVASAGAGGALAYLEQRRPRLGLLPVAVAIGAIVVAAVVMPPRTSHDLWSYTMYVRF